MTPAESLSENDLGLCLYIKAGAFITFSTSRRGCLLEEVVYQKQAVAGPMGNMLTG